MMDEAIGYLRRITRGIEINEETLATDVIRHVGPEGDFQNNDHTRKFSKTEFWNPNLFDRQKFDAWKAEGKQPMRQRVIERARKIVGSHKPSAVKPETDEVIKKTMESAENRVKNRSA
jgi:trimethylamine--corrinoid protein Co-methyltransferase